MGGMTDDRKAVMVAAALLAVYVFWGGTYLAIRFAVETIPPFFMAGARFILAGALLYGAARYSGAAVPTRAHWQGAGCVGLLLLAGGNGCVVFAAQMVPSGLVALLVATSPLWMVLMNWLWLKAAKPSGMVWAGVALGLIGIGVLAGGESALLGASAVSPAGAAILTVGAVSWAVGSIYTRKAALPDSAAMATAVEMLVGGGALMLLGLAAGEWGRFDPAGITAKSAFSFLYLVLFGSLVGFSAYVWVLQNASPVLVSTYAYVNPVVAVLLGAVLGGEALSGRILVSALVIVASVVMLTAGQLRQKPARKGAGRLPTGKACMEDV